MLQHIVHFLADDLGWADVGYHRAPNDTDVNTTHIDALARGGVRLERFYTFKYCSPSRSALQTGRNPIHVNVQNVDPDVSNPDDPIGGGAETGAGPTPMPCINTKGSRCSQPAAASR